MGRQQILNQKQAHPFVPYRVPEGTQYVAYRDRKKFPANELDCSRKITIGRWLDERILGWFIPKDIQAISA